MATKPVYQYQLKNTDTPGADYDAAGLAAKGIDGRGVIAAVIDDGFQTNHPAFTNLNTSLSFDYSSGIANPAGLLANAHGTAVAGVLLGSAAWGGPVGIAPGATFEALRTTLGKPVPGSPNANLTADQLSALGTSNLAIAQATRTADVANNSYGTDGLGRDVFKGGQEQGTQDALQNAVTMGRGGKGLNMVFAAGNAGDKGDDVSFQATGSDPRVITVGGINGDGTPSIDLTHGAGLLVSGPANQVVTTARYDTSVAVPTDANGLPTGSYAPINGTSFSAPGVSGVIALMLQVNPNLGWRDVQEILVDSARKPGANALTKPDGTPWFTTLKTGDLNGGGRQFSTAYGYGTPDATLAVELARTYRPSRNSANLTTDTVTASPGAVVTGGGAATLTTLTYNTSLRIEHVQLNLVAPSLLSQNVRLILTAPDGSQSVVADQAGSNQDLATLPPGPATAIMIDNADGTKDASGNVIKVPNSTALDVILNDAGFWSVNARGTWTLSTQDFKTGETGTIQSWGLTFWGDTIPTPGSAAAAAAAPTAQVYTPDYAAAVAADPTRAVVRPTAGTIIDAAELSGRTMIDMRGGAGMLGGVAVNVVGGVGNVVGGAGATTLIGIAGASNLTAGDGDTAIFGMAGNTLVGGIGRDTLTGGGNSTIFSGKAGAVVALNNGDVLLGSGPDTVIGGTGTATHFDFTGGAIAYAGTGGRLQFVGGAGSSTVIGGGGSVFGVGSGKGDVIAGGKAGNNILITGTGDSTLFGGGDGDALFAQGGGTQLVAAGAGNETLFGGNAATAVTYFVGTGNDLIGLGKASDVVFGASGNASVIGGTGADLFAFAAGRGGGSTTIANFNTAKGDRVTLQGYSQGTVQQALATATNTANGYTLTLADNTRISFTNIGKLDATAFV